MCHSAALVTLSFSTCHVVLSKEYYDKTVVQGEPSDEENDLLDLACVVPPSPNVPLPPHVCAAVTG